MSVQVKIGVVRVGVWVANVHLVWVSAQFAKCKRGPQVRKLCPSHCRGQKEN